MKKSITLEPSPVDSGDHQNKTQYNHLQEGHSMELEMGDTIRFVNEINQSSVNFRNDDTSRSLNGGY